MTSDIDFVITWVDGSDPKWLADRAKYAPKNEKIDESRYRDWGFLKYWFRAVEANAPWVRKIHFVTYGHIPEWLNTNHPKLHIVKHEDFIDKKFLPTFNSCAIEMNLHKIPGLAEKFVYFNDDMFLNRRVKPEFFFKNGLPRDSFVLKPIYPIENCACKIQNACMRIINENFKKTDINKKKLFSIKNGVYNLMNLVQYAYPPIVGINSKHLPQGYLKSTIEEIWQKESKKLIEVSSHKFRAPDDCSQWLFQYWQLASGRFAPNIMNQSGCYHISSTEDAELVAKTVKNAKKPLICINDNEKTLGYEDCGRIILRAFRDRYMQRSLYEK